MNKFKVGDKVRLKNMTRDEFDGCDTGAGMLTQMLEFAGQVHTVIYVADGVNYRLENPIGDEFFYSPNWIEPVTKFKGNK